MTMLRWLVAGVLGCVIVVDSVLTLRLWRVAMGHDAVARIVVTRQPNDAGVPDLLRSGLTVDGAPLPSDGPPGPLVVRYAAKGCPYSHSDEVWTSFAEEMRSRGAKVAVLLSAAKQAFDGETLVPSGIPQAAFVSLEWMSRFRLSSTPTVLLFDAGGALVWAEEGTLRSDSIERAVRALERTAPETGSKDR
jgi:hypothetical protein